MATVPVPIGVPRGVDACDVQEANVALFVAAPDLLQAAEKALEYLVSEPVVAAGLDAFEVGSQLRRAIRLARGGAA